MEEHKNLWVCSKCLAAISSHEGIQATLEHYIDCDETVCCDWCEEEISDVLYELI